MRGTANISNLLTSTLRPLAWGRTLKTSIRTTSARNWKIKDLLGTPLLDDGIGQDSRHFHPLFHNHREPARDGQEILGTAITCSAIGLSNSLNASIRWSSHVRRICTKGQTSASAPCGAAASSPALSFLCPLQEWCLYSDRAIATLCRSCFSHERRRLSIRRRAAPSPSSLAPIMAPAEDTSNWVDHCCVKP